MKKLLILTFLTYSGVLHAEKYSNLYGFSLGEPIENVSKKLGNPDKVIEFDDKSRGTAFFREKYYVAFVTIPPKNDFIYSIQVTGEKSPPKGRINGVGLGDSAEKVIKTFGKPSFTRDATDMRSGSKVDNTQIYFYGENFSFEIKNNIVTSLKLTYDDTISSDNPSDKKLMEQRPVELQKVQKHLLDNDYPEVFNDKTYRIAINGYRLMDIGNDGIKEVVLLFKPHFLQSPTIVIYQILKDGSVKRVREALAPGPLVKRGDYHLDSHTLGMGVDFAMEGKALSVEDGRDIAKTTTKKSGFGLMVQYKDFFHADSRKGANTYIDMTHVKMISDKKTCEDFEFSTVEHFEVGTDKKDSKIGIIAAKVGKYIYLYKIKSISDDGFLDKELKIIDTTKNK